MGDLYFILLLAAAGIVAGYTGALFGVGGGTVLVPTFLAIFGVFDADTTVTIHCAIGTSLALVVVNGFASAYRQHEAKQLDIKKLKSWTPFVLLGAVIGVLCVAEVSAVVLKWVFMIYLYACLVFVFFKNRMVEQERSQEISLPVQGIGGAVIGALSVMLGVGGGTFIVPFYSALNYSIKKAIAISSATTIVIGLVGTIGAIIAGIGVPGRLSYSIGYVNWLAVLVCAPFVFMASPWGVVSANRCSHKQLHGWYMVFLGFMAVYMTLQIVFHFE